jgi:diphthamide synthase subunit DPH2
MTGGRGRRRRQLLNDLKEKILEFEREHWIALSGELALEEVMDLSQDDYVMSE